MIRLKTSKAIQRLKPSPTLAVTAKASQLKAEGVDVIDLSVGEPDLLTPPFIQQAAWEAIQSGQTKYTAVDGTLALKKAIQEKFKNENKLEISLKEITVGCGAKQVIFNALLATLDPGDEVIIPAPCWVSYPDIVAFTGATPILLSCPESQGFKLTPTQLETAITPRTKWFILNSPCNPTGAVYTPQELEALGAVLAKHPHVWVLSDDIYEHLIYDTLSFETMAVVTPSLKERTLTVNGVSKAYAMTGWRIGYGAGPETLIKAMATLQSQSTSCPSSVSQAAACFALQSPEGSPFILSSKSLFQERRNLLMGALKKTPQFSLQQPGGAFYLYVGCSPLIGSQTPRGDRLTSDQDIATYLLEEARVAVVPGEAFSLSPYLRFAYAMDTNLLTEAANRVSQAITLLTS